MLTPEDMALLIKSIEESVAEHAECMKQVVRQYVEPVEEQSKLHLEFHKQLAERINKMDERLSILSEYYISKK